MNCDTLQAQLTAWRDGELPPETTAEIETHLASCAECTRALAKLSAVEEMAAVWTVATVDLTERVLNAVAADEQSLLLEEIHALRTEMQTLRAEVSDLRRRLAPRDNSSTWFPQAKPNLPRMENDPWNSTRS